MVEEEQMESSEQGGAPEELATCYSTQDQAMMQDCYSKIVEKLSIANPAMVLQVDSYTETFTLFHGQSLYQFHAGNLPFLQILADPLSEALPIKMMHDMLNNSITLYVRAMYYISCSQKRHTYSKTKYNKKLWQRVLKGRQPKNMSLLPGYILA